ncbi:CoA transferase [Streptomyces fuscichromogenes]|uniref:CoA transferase n=1 Tax=Streptomyces fuscichromogenes TaxID=1324013 RepID=UPI0037F91C68
MSERLVRESDAVHSSLRGDVPARIGITYDDLRHLNPALVRCSLTGWAMTGPRRRCWPVCTRRGRTASAWTATSATTTSPWPSWSPAPPPTGPTHSPQRPAAGRGPRPRHSQARKLAGYDADEVEAPAAAGAFGELPTDRGHHGPASRRRCACPPVSGGHRAGHSPVPTGRRGRVPPAGEAPCGQTLTSDRSGAMTSSGLDARETQGMRYSDRSSGDSTRSR